LASRISGLNRKNEKWCISMQWCSTGRVNYDALQRKAHPDEPRAPNE
jgi:hypothetical protein